MKTKFMRTRICIVPNCKNKPVTRGLCKNCYSVASMLIRKGFTSWEQLEAEDKALSARKVNQGKTAFFLS